MLRDAVGLPLLVAYMLCLVLAAWPAEIRPAVLDGLGTAAYDALAVVGVRAGIPVFVGTPHKQPSIIRARCIEVKGVDAAGAEIELYPPEPCPRRGFQWKPMVYEHSLHHWNSRIADGVGESNLWAMGDHFCQQSPAAELLHVEISKTVHVLDYASGREWSRNVPIGRVRCRTRSAGDVAP